MQKPEKEKHALLQDPELFMAMDDLELVAHGVVEGALSGNHISKYLGFSNEFDSHRNYISGDDLRYVNWNLWAKTDRLFVKQFEADTNLHLYLMVDQSRSMLAQNSGISKWAYAARAVASLAYLSLKNRDAVGLYLLEQDWGNSIPPLVKTGHLQHIIAILEQSKVEDDFPVNKYLERLPELFNRKGIVVLFSDLLDNEEELLKTLDIFKQDGHQVIVFQVLDPMEIELPKTKGLMEFVGLEGGGKRRGNSHELAEVYAEVVNKWQKRLNEQFNILGIDWIRITTNQPLQDVIVEYLLKRIHIN